MHDPPLMPSADAAKYLIALAKHATQWEHALRMADLPPEAHEPCRCGCVSCFLWRTSLPPSTALDPDQPPTPAPSSVPISSLVTKEPSMPFTRRPKTADPGTMLLCPSCAVSTPKDDKRGPWQTCSADCRSTRRALAAALNALAAHGLPDTAEFRSWLAVRPKLWLASQHPKVVRVPAEEGGTLRLAPAPRPGPLEPHHGGYERPWMHLDVDDIRQQWEAHQQAEADAAAPKRNDRGESCYGCGATHAGAWFTVPPPTRPTSVSRRNVSDVVVCDACETDLHAADGDRDRFADRLAVRALFPHLLPSRRRYVTDLAEMFEWRLFGELHAPGTEGTTVPFGYLGGDLLDQARSRAWTIRPRYAPPSFRARQDRAAAAVARVMPSAPAPSGPPAAVRLPDLTIDADEHQEVALP